MIDEDEDWSSMNEIMIVMAFYLNLFSIYCLWAGIQ